MTVLSHRIGREWFHHVESQGRAPRTGTMEKPQQRVESGGLQGDGKGTDRQRISERQERVDRVGRRTARTPGPGEVAPQIPIGGDQVPELPEVKSRRLAFAAKQPLGVVLPVRPGKRGFAVERAPAPVSRRSPLPLSSSAGASSADSGSWWQPVRPLLAPTPPGHRRGGTAPVGCPAPAVQDSAPDRGTIHPSSATTPAFPAGEARRWLGS